MEEIGAAVKRINEENVPIRQVSRGSGIDRMTLTRYKNKCNKDDINGCQLSHVGYWGNRRVFTNEEEQLLTEYLKKLYRIYFGLTSEEVRKLAFEFAFKNNIGITFNWTKKQLAGIVWFQGFMKRQKDISLTTESTSIARVSSFNEVNVARFCNLLEEIKSR